MKPLKILALTVIIIAPFKSFAHLTPEIFTLLEPSNRLILGGHQNSQAHHLFLMYQSIFRACENKILYDEAKKIIAMNFIKKIWDFSEGSEGKKYNLKPLDIKSISMNESLRSLYIEDMASFIINGMPAILKVEYCRATEKNYERSKVKHPL